MFSVYFHRQLFNEAGKEFRDISITLQLNNHLEFCVCIYNIPCIHENVCKGEANRSFKVMFEELKKTIIKVEWRIWYGTS